MVRNISAAYLVYHIIPKPICAVLITLVTLPELIAQTNMDQQSVNRLREELLKMTNWLAKNATTYFVKEYETPSQSYIEKARGNY